jgi:2-polyprenyl-3-methyl-5-hydroxy-6-metoxy-1,4-benzoquinol methylase
MITSKEYYRSYIAGDDICQLNINLVHEILKENPNHVLEFGCGTGKNLRLIKQKQISYAKDNTCVTGVDISLVNVINAIVKNGVENVAIGDETYLRHYCNYDVVFCCSVLDHIENVDNIIQELQRIANKCVILAECTDHDPNNYYYSHDLESLGFKVIEGTEYFSPSDNHAYRIYKWDKQNQVKSMADFVNNANDDFAK